LGATFGVGTIFWLYSLCTHHVSNLCNERELLTTSPQQLVSHRFAVMTLFLTSKKHEEEKTKEKNMPKCSKE